MKKTPHKPQKSLSHQEIKSLHELSYETILKLETLHGINASSEEGRYATFFGRDSMITGLKLLRIYNKKPDDAFLRIIKNTIQTAVRLQGKTMNPNSGEEPGKIIHEYREVHQNGFMVRKKPWFIYPDKTLRNYDSVDSTPLFLILSAQFYDLTRDEEFLKQILPSVEKAFDWTEKFGDIDKRDVFLEYLLQRPEKFGGLVNQGWMDSEESLLIEGEPPKEPVSLVEVQGYYFKALRLWANILQKTDKQRSLEFENRSRKLKEQFNQLFLMHSENLYYFAQANFGLKVHIQEIRTNPGHCLWASVKTDGNFESIIDDKYIPDVVTRLMKPDMFDPNVGIRTLSKKSKFFDACSYHNGSIWPFDNGLIAEGFENFGFKGESEQLKTAVLTAIKQFQTSIELYCSQDGEVKEWRKGKLHSAQTQAWTAATILDFTT
jgi:glycogen debranching enzyme